MSDKRSVPVRLEKVTKIFKDQKTKTDVIAVNEADFELAPGELVTLLGPSGCGKTTTLRMIGGFELPTRGRISIGGEDVTFLPPNGRSTATVFQSYGLFPHLTVFDNVAYGLRVRKVEKADMRRRVEEALALVGLSELAGRAPSGSPAASSSASPWRGASSWSPRSSSWTSRCPTWTRSCASRCAWRSAASRRAWGSPPST